MAPATTLTKRVLLIGLGNFSMPAQLHSVGAIVLDNLAERFSASWKYERPCGGYIATVTLPTLPASKKPRKATTRLDKSLNPLQTSTATAAAAGEGTTTVPLAPRGPTHVELILLKPKTYMNVTGPSVKAALKSLQLQPQDIIAVHDELEKDWGRFALKQEGSAGGHNGITSIIKALDTNKFRRLRVGIGRPQHDKDLLNYLLTPLNRTKLQNLQEDVIPGALHAIFKETNIDPSQ